MLYGALRPPAGHRQTDLLGFIHRVAGSLPRLAYDTHAATLHAQVRANAAAAGRPLAEPDAHIASVALANNLTLATRNIRDFQGIDGLTWSIGSNLLHRPQRLDAAQRPGPIV